MTIIVTGASGALGQEVCKVLLENGQDVAPIRGVDLADADQAQKAISEIAERSGPIQGLVLMSPAASRGKRSWMATSPPGIACGQ